MNNLILSASCQIPNLADIYKTYFKNLSNGVFVEVGAFDGDSYSNTSGLADIGWRGVYVEPVSEFAERCRHRHAKNNVIVVNAAVDPSITPKTIDLYVGDALTTLLNDHVDLYKTIPWAKDVEFKKSSCQTTRLDQLLISQNIKPNFDLLIIDVEGMEEKIFESFYLPEWHPKMLIIELVDKHPDFQSSQATVESCQRLRKGILENGYRTVYEDVINTVFISTNL